MQCLSWFKCSLLLTGRSKLCDKLHEACLLKRQVLSWDVSTSRCVHNTSNTIVSSGSGRKVPSNIHSLKNVAERRPVWLDTEQLASLSNKVFVFVLFSPAGSLQILDASLCGNFTIQYTFFLQLLVAWSTQILERLWPLKMNWVDCWQILCGNSTTITL